MTFDQLIEHVTDTLPGRKVSLRYDSEYAANRYGFSLWEDFRIVDSAYAATVDDLRAQFDAWFAEHDFSSPWDGVTVELREVV
jgi:hypothetical protein